jgi:hypothetical protein
MQTRHFTLKIQEEQGKNISNFLFRLINFSFLGSVDIHRVFFQQVGYYRPALSALSLAISRGDCGPQDSDLMSFVRFVMIPGIKL